MNKTLLRFLLAVGVLSSLLIACCCVLDEQEFDLPPEQEPTEMVAPEGDAEPVESDEHVADMGFRPDNDGFRFENYGSEQGGQDLTAVEVRRMFGDQVCASVSGGECLLTPPARQWMEEMNEAMADGHCEGMAVLSLLFYFDQLQERDFGNSTTYGLSLSGNEKLQREIAYWWATQDPVWEYEILGSPNEILDRLVTALADGSDSFTIGIFYPDGSGGHAVTPFAVQDFGGGKWGILVYDNNYPGSIRIIDIDRNANAWSYEAAINPGVESDLYRGDADTQTLALYPTSKRLGVQPCSFCADDEWGRAYGTAVLAQRYNEIWLDGDADLLLTDEQGRRYGYADGEFVTEIPGVRAQTWLYQVDVWNIDQEPVYYVPLGMAFNVTVDAGRLAQDALSEVTMIGPGYDLVIADLWLDAGEKDVITFSPDGREISYRTDYNDSPDIVLGVETEAADYEFIVAALDIEAGAEFFVRLDMDKGQLSINTRGAQEYGTYEVVMLRINDAGEQWFQNDDIYLEPNDTAYLRFFEWEGPGDSLFIDIDYGSDGSIDESIELVDEYVK